MIGGERGLRPLFPWPFAVSGAERLATAQCEFEVAEFLADALGEVMGAPRTLVLEIVDRCGIEFARERYATTVAIEASEGMCRQDGRRLTPGAVFFRLVRDGLEELEWDALFQPPDLKTKIAAANVALRRVVPKWREEALARAATASTAPPTTAPSTLARRSSKGPRQRMTELPAQITALLEEEPRRIATVREIAERLRMPPKDVRPVVRLLWHSGQILRTSRGYSARERRPLALSDALEILDPEGVLAAHAPAGAQRG